MLIIWSTVHHLELETVHVFYFSPNGLIIAVKNCTYKMTSNVRTNVCGMAFKPENKPTININDHVLDRFLMDRVKFENRPVHTQQRFQNPTVQSNNKTAVQLTLRLSIHLIQSISYNGTFDSSQKVEESKF